MVFRRHQDSGAFGRGGQRPVSVRMEFTGQLGPVFTTFAQTRAERLDLKGWIIGQEHRALVYLDGPEALIGAFEVACCIGPDAATIEDWTCSEAPPDPTVNGFQVRLPHPIEE